MHQHDSVSGDCRAVLVNDVLFFYRSHREATFSRGNFRLRVIVSIFLSIGTYFAADSCIRIVLYQEVCDGDASYENPSGCPRISSRFFIGCSIHDRRTFKGREEVGCLSAAAAATEMVASARETTAPSTAAPSDRKPGQAWKTIGGTIKHVKGDVYTVEDYEGNQVRLYISRETKQLRGNKKVGDRVRAEITRSGFVNSIQ